MKTRERLKEEFDNPTTKLCLINLHQTFHGGQIAGHHHEWEKLTSDPTILQMVKGDIIENEANIPLQHLAKKTKLTSQEELLIDKALEEVFEKEIRTRTRICPPNFYYHQI